MRHTKELKLIDELVTVAEIHPNPTSIKGPSKSFGIMSYNISYVGFEALKTLETTIQKLLKAQKEISETYTYNKFEQSIIELVRTLKKSNRKCTEDEYGVLINSLLSVPVEESEIFYNLHGAQMVSDILVFGDFTIYNYNLSINKLKEVYAYLRNSELCFKDRKSELLLSIKVKSREQAKAVEIANGFCETFEHTFNYAIADLGHLRSVGVFNFRGWKSVNITVCHKNTLGWHGKNDTWFPVDIEDHFFKDASQGNDKIWQLITKRNKTEIEKRLLISIEWVGKAVHEKNVSNSLVQFVFAIEGMLQYNPGAFVTSSIISQISDWLAFIIQDNKDERKKIAAYFKDIYKKRSAVAHGASAHIEPDDLGIALQIAKLMIQAFLCTTPFCDMKTMNELDSYINELKYA